MIKKKLKNSKGFLTKKGSFIDYTEWHTVASSVAAMALSPEIWVILTLKLLVDENRRMGSFNEYVNELPYWLLAGVSTALILGVQLPL